MKYTASRWKKEEIPFIKKATELVKDKKDYWKVIQNRGEYLCVGFTTSLVKRNQSGFGKRYISYKELEKYIPDEMKKKWYNKIKSKEIEKP